MLRLIVILTALAFLPLQTLAAPRPNVLLILADDMGFSDVGCYGGDIHTPSIDSLARDGVRLAQFYTMARCCPSRAALLTGLYPHQAGIGAMNQDLGKPAYRGELNDRCATLAETLRAAGYRTAMTGKWHLCHLTISPGGPKARQLVNFEREDAVSPSKANWPCNRGFDDHWGTIAGVENYYDPYSLVHNESPLKPDNADFYYTDFITDHSVKAIEQFAADAKPFFLYVAYTAPHWPIQAREADVARYAKTYAAGWDAIRQARFDRQVAMGLVDASWGLPPRANSPPLNEGASAVGPWENAAAKEWQARRMAVYAAMIENMDRGIGRILDTLKRKNLDRDTIVVFLSDNGGCAENVQPTWYDVPSKTRDGRNVTVGNNPDLMPGPETVYQSYGPAWANASNTPFRRFKHFTEEGGISAPFVVRWPAGQGGAGTAGRIDRATVGHVIDVVPTVLEAASVAYPKEQGGHEILPAEGKSLLKSFSGKPIADSRTLFWEHEGNRAVRIGDWKLLAAHNEKWQLYDIAHDRAELHDVATANPDKVAELKAAYDTWAARCGVETWPVKKN
jgi:arylsulfatase